MKVAITGSSGLIGSALVESLRGDGHDVLRLVREEAASPDKALWDPMAGTVDDAALDGTDAVVNLAEVLEEVLAATGYTAADIDWVVPHQANRRILDATAKKLGLPPEKIVITVDRHANTSAASVPLAFDVARRDGRLKPGDLVMLEAMGGGFTWAASLVRL